MRRVLTTLMILLVVLVAGLSALVLLVNPNDFRAYMVRQVEARSGMNSSWTGRCAGTSGRSSAFSPDVCRSPRRAPRSRLLRRITCVLMSRSSRSYPISSG